MIKMYIFLYVFIKVCTKVIEVWAMIDYGYVMYLARIYRFTRSFRMV